MSEESFSVIDGSEEESVGSHVALVPPMTPDGAVSCVSIFHHEDVEANAKRIDVMVGMQRDMTKRGSCIARSQQACEKRVPCRLLLWIHLRIHL